MKGPTARWAVILSGVAALLLLQGLALLSPQAAELEPEELYNAGQAVALTQGHLADLWRLQYRPFCGGCSLDALLGAGIFTVIPPSWLAWKLVPLAWTALLGVVGARLLWREVGMGGAAAFLALLAFPPRAWLQLSLIAWGNHYESAVLSLVLLALVLRPGRAGRAGVVAGLSLWVGFSSAPAVLAAVAWLTLQRRWSELGRFLLFAPLGLTPWLGQWWTTHGTAFTTIYQPGEALPRLDRLPHKLWTLFAPRQLIALFAPRHATLALATAGAALLSLILPTRAPLTRALRVFLGVWVVVYLLVRFQLYLPPTPDIAGPGDLRYAAPLYPLLMALGAAAFATHLRRHPVIAGGLLGVALLGGLGTRWQTLHSRRPMSGLARLRAIEPARFRLWSSWHLSRQAHATCTSGAPADRAWHAYAIGREDAQRALDGAWPQAPNGPTREAWWQGVGEGLADRVGDADTATLARLDRVGAILSTWPGATEDDLRGAARAAAWRELGLRDAWREPLGSHDAESLRWLRSQLHGSPPLVADGAWFAAGRRLALDEADLLQPEPIHLPGPAVALPTAFVEGIGMGLGEAWGPQPVLHPPAALSAGQRQVLLRGYREGERWRWLGEPVTPRLR